MTNNEFQFWMTALMMVCGLVVVVVLLVLRQRNQQMRHQERLAAIEKGAALPPHMATAPWSPRVYLLRGLIWSFTGGAIVIALLLVAMASHRPYHESVEILASKARNVSERLQIPIEQAREIVAKDEAERAEQNDGPSPAIALFGLIPLGVGLAYIVYYRSGETRANRVGDSAAQD